MVKRRDIVIILTVTFITIVCWIASNIYHIAVTSTLDEELQTQIIPIQPQFDMETISGLSSRERVEPAYNFDDSQISRPTPSAAPALPSAEASPSPVPAQIQTIPVTGTEAPESQAEPEITDQPVPEV